LNSEFNKRRRAGYQEGFISIVVNTLLFIIKYYVGVISNSIAVIADSIHTLSDTATSLILIISYRYASKPADEEHPFGHGRFELLGSLVIGVLLGVAGFEFGFSSIEKLLSKETLVYSDLLVLVLITSTLTKGLLTLWPGRLGVKTESELVKADAWHHLTDTFATGLLAITIFIGRDYWWIDGVLGLLVSAIIIYTAWEISSRAGMELLGRGPTPSEIAELKQVIQSEFPMVSNIHHIHFHRYGDHVEVTLHVELPGGMSLKEAHDIASKIESTIREKFKYEPTVHVEPSGDSSGEDE